MFGSQTLKQSVRAPVPSFELEFAYLATGQMFHVRFSKKKLPGMWKMASSLKLTTFYGTKILVFSLLTFLVRRILLGAMEQTWDLKILLIEALL